MRVTSTYLLSPLLSKRKLLLKSALTLFNLTCRYNSDKITNVAFRTMTEQNVFKGKLDRFKGITIHSNIEQCASIAEFSLKLENSLSFWRINGNRGIWFHIHLSQAEWVPILAKQGFKFHHAREDYVMMYLWLPLSEICNIPQYAHTMIGVGAVVINDKNEVLAIQEKYPFRNMIYWKLPGGYVEPGENLVDAAIREVLEETGIHTEFQSILTIRHGHRRMFNCSDIYTVVSLRPLSADISKCEREIAECKWMPIVEYMNHKNIHEINKFQLQKYLEYKEKNIKINCFNGIHQTVNLPYTIYSVTKADEKNSASEKANGLIEDTQSHL